MYYEVFIINSHLFELTQLEQENIEVAQAILKLTLLMSWSAHAQLVQLWHSSHAQINLTQLSSCIV